MDWTEIESELRTLLGGVDGLEVDRTRVERFAADIRAGRLSGESNRLPTAEPPRAGEVVDLLSVGASCSGDYFRAGMNALEEDRVAVAVLNGGMATRFGGVVKGTLEAVDGASFLEIKREQAAAYGRPPFLSMNSFATHRATLEYLRDWNLTEGVYPFVQSVALRLTPEGELFRDGEGRVSPYAPGHGDFPGALRKAGLYDELRRQGVTTVLISNVDNLGADLDPTILGYHLTHGKPVTVEVAPSVVDDAGGGPARVDGRLQIVESFRLPEGFDLKSLPFVNTNTLWVSLDALAEDHPLTWFYVEKEVDGRTAVQVEHLVGQITAFVDSAYVLVPRDGRSFRYFPVKSPRDLETFRADPDRVKRVLESMGRL